MAMPQDPKAAFKAEWEALELTENDFILQNAASDLIKSSGANPIYHENNVAR